MRARSRARRERRGAAGGGWSRARAPRRFQRNVSLFASLATTFGDSEHLIQPVGTMSRAGVTRGHSRARWGRRGAVGGALGARVDSKTELAKCISF